MAQIMFWFLHPRTEHLWLIIHVLVVPINTVKEKIITADSVRAGLPLLELLLKGHLQMLELTNDNGETEWMDIFIFCCFLETSETY